MELNTKELLIVVQVALPAAHVTVVGFDQHGTDCVRFTYLGQSYRFSKWHLSVEHAVRGMLAGDQYADGIQTILKAGLVKALCEGLIPII